MQGLGKDRLRSDAALDAGSHGRFIWNRTHRHTPVAVPQSGRQPQFIVAGSPVQRWMQRRAGGHWKSQLALELRELRMRLTSPRCRPRLRHATCWSREWNLRLIQVPSSGTAIGHHAAYAHITSGRDHDGDACETLLSGFSCRWVGGVMFFSPKLVEQVTRANLKTPPLSPQLLARSLSPGSCRAMRGAASQSKGRRPDVLRKCFLDC